MISFNVNVKLNTSELQKRSEQALRAAQMQLDNDVLKDSNYFIPADKWNLRDRSTTASQVGEGKLIWDAPYSRRLYYGTNFKFSKDENPKASSLWFERAKAEKKDTWLETTKRKYYEYFNGR